MKASQPMRIQMDVKVPMRDGVSLASDVYLPPEGGPFPALVIRTIYHKQDGRYTAWTKRFVDAGYAVVMQDCRGRHDSEGAWEPYVHEEDDGFDTHQWMGSQSWCDGNVGTFGVSYVGFTQTVSALQRSPYLKGIAPIASQQDNFGHFYVDGALQLHVAMYFMNMAGKTMKRGSTAFLDWPTLWRSLPLVSALDDIVDLPFFREAIRHSTFDEFWNSYGLRGRFGEAAVPAYFMTGWYDNLVHEGFKQFTGWRAGAGTDEARRHTKLLVGPWSHSNIGSAEPFGDVDFGAEAAVDHIEEQIRWYDRRLRGIDNGIDDEPAVRVFVMGANTWRTADEWPLPETQYTKFYLRGRGPANSLYGEGALSREAPGDESPDRYSYDPERPVPSVGGPYMLLDNSGPFDRRMVERRDDVLVYSTPPLEDEIEVTGPISLTLHASSTAPDTDFTGTLVDVHPDGRATILSEGLLRARFRDSIESPELMEPGRVYEFKVDIWETSNLFKTGHRIRLEVSSSNFPRFDRNLNTGHAPGMDAEIEIADQTVYHDTSRPSHLTLPVIPRESG